LTIENLTTSCPSVLKGNLRRRVEIINAVRLFFEKEGFLEVETPQLVDAPIPERFIDAVKCGDQYFVPSPEVYMKRLISGKNPRIFQISKCFRAGETGKFHNEEFTMLEWYRTGADYFDLIDDALKLLKFVSEKIGFKDELVYKGDKINFNFEEISVDDAFLKFAGKKLELQPDSFEFDKILVEKIEPKLGVESPTVLYDYPSAFCPMSKPKKENPSRAERLEIYVAGIELANGCTEETDYDEQVRKLKEEQKARKEMGKEVYPWPEEFLESIKKMPDCSGMALGIDRLAMLLCDANHIKEVIT